MSMFFNLMAAAKKPYKRLLAYLEYPGGGLSTEFLLLKLGHKLSDCNKIIFKFQTNSTSQADILLGYDVSKSGWLGFGGSDIIQLNKTTLPVVTIPEIFTSAIKGNGEVHELSMSYDNSSLTCRDYMSIGGYQPIQFCQRKKIYQIQLFLDNRRLADYIPVLDWDNRPAMYDKVSGQFFYNQGTGEFNYA